MNDRLHRYDINRPRLRHGHKYTKQKMSQYNDGYMNWATPKQHLKLNLSNTEAELKKSVACKKKHI